MSGMRVLRMYRLRRSGEEGRWTSMHRRAGMAGSTATGSDAAGFTLTELLVVLAIIGLLIVAAPALLKTALPGSQSLAAAHALADDLRMARGLAVARGTTIHIAFDEEHQTYRTGNGTARTLPYHIRFAFAEPSAPHGIDFRPDGGASGAVLLVGERPAQHRVGADWLTGRIAIDE